MCVISMVAQDWNDRWYPRIEPFIPSEPIDWSKILQPPTQVTFTLPVSQAEFDAFKEEMRKELMELKKLLIAAKNYDTATGQKDCEDADKIALFKKLAELVGVDLTDVFAK